MVHFERDVRLSAVPSNRKTDATNGVDWTMIATSLLVWTEERDLGISNNDSIGRFYNMICYLSTTILDMTDETNPVMAPNKSINSVGDGLPMNEDESITD